MARESRGCREECQTGKGLALCGTGLIQLFHHVRPISLEFIQAEIYTDENRLLFMTYNGWVMLAVGVGAFLGYLAFGTQASPTKSVACH